MEAKLESNELLDAIVKLVTGPVFLGLFAKMVKWVYDRVRIPEVPAYDSSRDEAVVKAQQIYEKHDAPALKALADDIRLVRITDKLVQDELGDLLGQIERDFREGIWNFTLGFATAWTAIFFSWPSKNTFGFVIAAAGLVLGVIGGYLLVDVFKRTLSLRKDYQAQEVQALQKKAAELRACDPSRDDIGRILTAGPEAEKKKPDEAENQ